MGDFPWEVIKAETLRLIARDLGIKRSLKRDETIAFLRSVQKRGLGPALVYEISKDLGHSTSRQDDEDDTSSPAPPAPTSPPSTRTRSKPMAPASRRTTSRKRQAQEMEPSSVADNEDEDEDAEGSTDAGMDIEPVSISAIGRNARSRSNKRPRLSDPGPAPARNTRSKDAAQTSVSAMTLRSSPRRGSSARRTTQIRDQRQTREKRTSRRSRKQAPIEEEEEAGDDADADAEGEDDIDSEEETEKNSTGPGALAAVLTRASMQSKTPRSRGRPRKVPQKQVKVLKPRPSRHRQQRPVISQPPSGPSTDINVDSPRSRRTIKPTEKVALLGQLKRPTSILSKPVRPSGSQALHRGGVILSRVRFGVGGMSGGAKEVFDGVVLNKRVVSGNDRGLINGIVDYRNRGLQLDEFVANGIERQNALDNRNDDSMVTSDPVLDREDVSTLGGSNKENDFSFRDVSESSDGRVERAVTGEEDAEGEWEHDAPLTVNPSTLTQDLSQLQHQTNQLNLNDVQRAPFHEVAQPELPQSQLPQLQPPQDVPVVPVVTGLEPQPFVLEPQPQFQPQPVTGLQDEPQPLPSGLQTEPQTTAGTVATELETVVQSIT